MTDATDPIDAADAGEEADATDDACAPDDTCADATEDTDTDAQREFKKNARDALRKFLKSMTKRRGGADFYSLLVLLFIGLKLTGHIDWSWVWVLSPFWIRAAFRLSMAALVITMMKKLGWKPSGKT